MVGSRREGYWISPKGTVYPIHEHFDEIRSNLKRFGYSEAEASTWTREDRDRIVTATVLRGWIRVREHGNSTTFDVSDLTPDTIFFITEHLKKTGAWETEAVKVHEASRHRVFPTTAGWFMGGEALSAAANKGKKRRRS